MVFLGQDASDRWFAWPIPEEKGVLNRKSTEKARRRRFPSHASEDTVKIPGSRRSPLTMQRHNASLHTPALRSFGRSQMPMRRIGMRLSVAVVLLLFGSMVDAQTPTLAPSTSGPTLSPVAAATASPTDVPVVATLRPTMIPTTIAPTIDPPIAPSSRPTNPPTDAPSQFPTRTSEPSISAAPSTAPTLSAQPSQLPTDSQIPSTHPSARPSLSFAPSVEPSPAPSDEPSSIPSAAPSAFPTVLVPFFIKDRFRQEFVIPSSRFFNTTEEVLIGTLFASYTGVFAPNAVRVDTTCIVVEQNIVRPPQAATPAQRLRRLQTEAVSLNEVDYTCEYRSSITNVTSFPDLFLLYMNNNLANVTLDLQELGLNVTSVLGASLIQIQTPAPTISREPTSSPSARPTISFSPSAVPSVQASSFPTEFVTTPNPTRLETTFPPSLAPVTLSPTMITDDNGSTNTSLIVIIVVVVLAGVAILAGLFVFYRRRTRPREEEVTAARPRKNSRDSSDQPGTWNAVMAPSGDDHSHGVQAMVSPSESLLTSKSLLSAGSGMSGSGDEADNTKNLQDEFDQYKDQNLEQLRSDVEGNLTGFEGIMSAAVTRALMGGEVPRVDDSDLMWGAQGPQTGAEIEASALCDVNDWLKRNESATVERRRVFMQEMLNRMVSSVRFGVIEANDASLTIHESAALLGLQLANELPMTTVIISGMRKTVSSSHIVKALREFGEIDVAAVASGQRGFGIVRFRNPKSATLAIRRYRSGEIVVQDVAVQMQVLTPSGAVEGRLAGRRS
jgi:hypothetical protein